MQVKLTLNAAVHFADVDVVIANVHLLSISANVNSAGWFIFATDFVVRLFSRMSPSVPDAWQAINKKRDFVPTIGGSASVALGVLFRMFQQE